MATRDIRRHGAADSRLVSVPYSDDDLIARFEDKVNEGPWRGVDVEDSEVQFSVEFAGYGRRGTEPPVPSELRVPPLRDRTGASIIVRDTKTKDRWGRVDRVDVSPEGKLSFRVSDEGIARSLMAPTSRGAKLRVWFGGNRLTVTIPAGAVTRNPDGSFSGELLGNFGYFAEL